MKFGVIIPVYNEPRLKLLLARFDYAVTPLVVVVDDCSTDGSIDACRDYPVTVLRHERRSFVGAGIRTGLNYLRAQGCDVAVVIAGNNKDNPAEIPRLLAAIEAGADYVQGSRYLGSSEPVLGASARAERLGAMPFFRKFLTFATPVLWSLRFGRKLTEVTNGFRAYRLSMLDDPRVNIEQSWLDKYELELYLQYKALATGRHYVEVPVSKVYPKDGLSISKIQLFRSWDWWSFMRPFVLLTLGLRR